MIQKGVIEEGAGSYQQTTTTSYDDSMENFINSINSPYTEKTYKHSMKLYL